MAVFTVDSDAVFSATSAVRGTIDRVRAEHQAMLSQLTSLQSVWTGSAAVAFGSTVDQWRAVNHQVEESITAINLALETAGRQYADTEQANLGLFR